MHSNWLISRDRLAFNKALRKSFVARGWEDQPHVFGEEDEPGAKLLSAWPWRVYANWQELIVLRNPVRRHLFPLILHRLVEKPSVFAGVLLVLCRLLTAGI